MKLLIAFAAVSLCTTVSAFAANSNARNVIKTKTELDATKFAFLDNSDILADKSSFSVTPDDLLARAKHVLSPEIAQGTKDGGECLAENFEFCAAVVGPIGKKEYLGALGGFNLEEAFEISTSYYGLTVDPMQPNRVWFMSRLTGIHVGEFMGKKPDGKEIIYPPQIIHMDFDEELKMTEFGFYTADRRQGNTGGLGGAFGFMYGVGRPLPIPECRPYKKSLQFRLLSFVGRMGSKLRRNKE